MSGFAAILVLVACPVGYGECVREPVRVVSYESVAECDRSLPIETKRAGKYGMKIYGSCNIVDANLVTTRTPINFTAGASAYKTARVTAAPTGQAMSFSTSEFERTLAQRASN